MPEQVGLLTSRANGINAVNLESMGWNATRAAQWCDRDSNPDEPDDARPGRVARSDGSAITVWTATGPVVVRLGKRHRRGDARPVVGDWIVIAGPDDAARLSAALPRTTTVTRRAAGRRTRAQVVAANVDCVFIATSLDGDLNPRRLERYVTVVRDGGAQPVILLTKAGLCSDIAGATATAQLAAPGVRVIAVDAFTGTGLAKLDGLLEPRCTVALIGSSGVGKSTLLNAWLGRAAQRTEPVRARDARGQHTTTARELFVLPNGALVVDTPGMRELGLWAEEASLDAAFPDIEAVAATCRFRDCTHEHEPGCAVMDAVQRGTLDPARVDGYRALQAEVRETAAQMPEHERRRTARALHKHIRQTLRLKERRR